MRKQQLQMSTYINNHMIFIFDIKMREYVRICSNNCFCLSKLEDTSNENAGCVKQTEFVFRHPFYENVKEKINQQIVLCVCQNIIAHYAVPSFSFLFSYTHIT